MLQIKRVEDALLILCSYLNTGQQLNSLSIITYSEYPVHTINSQNITLQYTLLHI